MKFILVVKDRVRDPNVRGRNVQIGDASVVVRVPDQPTIVPLVPDPDVAHHNLVLFVDIDKLGESKQQQNFDWFVTFSHWQHIGAVVEHQPMIQFNTRVGTFVDDSQQFSLGRFNLFDKPSTVPIVISRV